MDRTTSHGLNKADCAKLEALAFDIVKFFKPLETYGVAIHHIYPESKFGRIYRINECDGISRFIDIVPNISAPVRQLTHAYTDPESRADAIELTPTVLASLIAKQSKWAEIYDQMKEAIEAHPLPDDASRMNQNNALKELEKLNYKVQELIDFATPAPRLVKDDGVSHEAPNAQAKRMWP